MRPVVVAVAALFAYLAHRSMSWVLIGDAPLYHYVAWRIREGDVPYRDIFEFNMPGVYLVHLLAYELGGWRDLPWRWFDLGCLALIMLLIYALARPLGDRWAAAGMALLFGVYHVADGPWMAGQRDFILAGLLLVGVLGVARFWESGGRLPPLVWSGLALGAGLTIKPHAGLLWAALAAVTAVLAYRLGRVRWLAPAILLASGCVFPGAVFLWLWSTGGWGPFLEILFDYTLPFYGPMTFQADVAWHKLGLEYRGWRVMIFLILLALLGLAARVAERVAVRRWCVLLGVAYGALHYGLQGKGYPYHLYPLLAFLLVSAVPVLTVRRPDAGTAAPAGGSLAWLLHPFRPGHLSIRHAAGILLVTSVGLLALIGRSDQERLKIEPFRVGVNRLTGRLANMVEVGSVIQAMDDTNASVIHALLRMEAPQPTGFIYDFPLFHDTDDPRIERLRQRFTRDLIAGRPAAVVVSRVTGNRKGYERLDDLPAVASFLDSEYEIEVSNRKLRIYLRKDLAVARRAGQAVSGGETAGPGL